MIRIKGEPMDDIENLRGKAGRALEQISADREEAQEGARGVR